MKKQIILCFLIIIIALCSAQAQDSDNSKISPQKRDKWIKENAAELRKFKPDTSTAVILPSIVNLADSKKISFRIIKQGLIKLSDGDWIYITAHSAHDNEEIGDIILAIDNNKSIFKSDGHVCGGIVHFETSQLTELKTTADFFKYFVSDTDSKGWEKLD